MYWFVKWLSVCRSRLLCFKFIRPSEWLGELTKRGEVQEQVKRSSRNGQFVGKIADVDINESTIAC